MNTSIVDYEVKDNTFQTIDDDFEYLFSNLNIYEKIQILILINEYVPPKKNIYSDSIFDKKINSISIPKNNITHYY